MFGAYIHIPFCRHKCGYCDFNSYAGIPELSEAYTAALIGEIDRFRASGLGSPLDTVYIGGGTPTYINDRLLLKILSALDKKLYIRSGAEITVECNPGTADERKLKNLFGGGVNRLSLGLQSADDGILKRLGRIHTYADFLSCFSAARSAGFKNISVDLMFGLPGQSCDIWLDTIDKTAALSPEHISAYSLKIEEGTPFFELHSRGELDVPDDDENRDMYDMAAARLREEGYHRYEISNFAKPGAQSRHNTLYWTLEDYIGFGAGAHSYIGGRRYSNVSDVREYISRFSKGDDIQTEYESGSLFDTMCEFVFLGLRMDCGISKAEFKKRFGTDIYEVFGNALKRHTEILGTLEDSGDRLRIKSEYIYVSNQILSDFV
ncbi:MAG TPA: radical SAM family heme chaperone HemW [Candidatus Monoglobus merdigallinarum]|uniref:Heme chaperone HemW n=1 Tax=Candidatus Monoglobus merdigallinarum TaxID=2838698 RepID=A0A9D1TLP9_9FIRM|nr:radical SAM family heme chaperone HemW [Candidatus Monoglobus merdigallinarum]